MSIAALPNQPVNLTASPLQGCICDPLTPATLIGADDTFEFVLRAFSCADADQLLTNTNFDANTWKGNRGFVITPGTACCSVNNAGATLVENDFTPSIGETYELRFNITDVQGVLNVVLGGLSVDIVEPGQYSYTFVATSTQRFRLTLVSDLSLVCLDSILVFEGNRSITVTFKDAKTGVEVYAVDATADPDLFTYLGDSVIVSILMEDTGVDGCFYVEVEDCDDATPLRSQDFQVITDTSCTLLLSGCNDYDGLGLPQEFTPRLRVLGKLVRPSWEYEVSEERRSNGRWVRHYADRQTRYELRIDLQNEGTLPFVAALPVFHHFYVGQAEYSIDPEAIEPTYQDVFDSTGGVILSVRPKQELVRNVRCEAENVAGCPPPPNYLVQGTGPNTDYILTQNGERILLN